MSQRDLGVERAIFALGGIIVGGGLVNAFGQYDCTINTNDINTNDRETAALEHGFSDPQVAKSLEQKLTKTLTEKFGKSGYEITVMVKTHESSEQSQSEKPKKNEPSP